MAKYDVTYACGHSGTVQLFGATRDREYRLRCMRGDLCPACFEENRRQKAEELKTKAAEAGLPELSGTERQRVWAEQLRAEFIRITKEKREIVREEAVPDYDLTVAYLLQKRTRASDWIDARDEGVVYTIQANLEAARMAASPAPVQSIPDMQDVKAEATVQPEDVSHVGTVEIGVTDETVRLKYIKDDTFREVVKKHGFTWNSDRKTWERKTSWKTGSADDRAAEIGNILLREGFAVTIYSDDLRRRAIEADFEPERKCWISSLTKTGDFCVIWPRDGEDFYSQAKRLHGAQWSRDSGGVVVPPESWQEILDFAEINGFGISPGAQRLIEKQRAIKITTVCAATPEAPEREDLLKDILASSDEVIDDLTDK